MDEINQEKEKEKIDKSNEILPLVNDIITPENKGDQEKKEDIIKNEFPHEDLDNINQEKEVQEKEEAMDNIHQEKKEDIIKNEFLLEDLDNIGVEPNNENNEKPSEDQRKKEETKDININEKIENNKKENSKENLPLINDIINPYK